MRKLLLCDLDLDLDFYSGVLRIHFLMEREKVFSTLPRGQVALEFELPKTQVAQ